MGFSPRTAKLLIGSKNVMGCKNGTDLLYHHGKYGGDRGSRVGCRRKSVTFLFFVFFYVTLSNYEVCDNGNGMKQYNFQNNYGVIVVVVYNNLLVTLVTQKIVVDRPL